jgi:hypothetical protein
MNDYPWFPANSDYEKEYVRDKNGTVWLHHGGMVTTADYSGQIWSAGITWLRENYGPLEKAMNTEQRQLLASSIDSIEREIEELEQTIETEQNRLLKRQARLHELKNRRTKLREGIDW